MTNATNNPLHWYVVGPLKKPPPRRTRTLLPSRKSTVKSTASETRNIRRQITRPTSQPLGEAAQLIETPEIVELKSRSESDEESLVVEREDLITEVEEEKNNEEGIGAEEDENKVKVAEQQIEEGEEEDDDEEEEIADIIAYGTEEELLLAGQQPGVLVAESVDTENMANEQLQTAWGESVDHPIDNGQPDTMVIVVQHTPETEAAEIEHMSRTGSRASSRGASIISINEKISTILEPVESKTEITMQSQSTKSFNDDRKNEDFHSRQSQRKLSKRDSDVLDVPSVASTTVPNAFDGELEIELLPTKGVSESETEEAEEHQSPSPIANAKKPRHSRGSTGKLVLTVIIWFSYNKSKVIPLEDDRRVPKHTRRGSFFMKMKHLNNSE